MSFYRNLTLLLAFSFSLFANEKVVATVNGEKILKSEFDKIYEQSRLYVSNTIVTKKKILDDLIAKRVGIQKAKDNKLDRDPVVREKIEDILYHAQISKDLEPEFKKIKVTENDVKNYYNENKEYRTAQILLRLKAKPTNAEIEKVLAAATDMFNRIKAEPNKFAEFANQYSQISSAPNGGDMGFQPPVRLAPQYYEAIKGKPVGYITRPVRSQFGYHIIKVLAVKDFKSINMGLYKKIIYDQKRDAILDGYFEGLRKSASVKVNKENL